MLRIPLPILLLASASLLGGCEFLEWQALRGYLAANPHLEREDGPRRYETELAPLRLVPVVDRFEFPWDLAFPSAHEALVTEKPGRLSRVDLRTGTLRPISGVPEVAFVGQGGLLGIELDPDHADNGRIYLCYAVELEPGRYTTRLLRARLDGDRLVEREILLTAEPVLPAIHHFGGALELAPDGTLFLSVGDRKQRHDAQKLDSHLGKILRLHLDGSAPADNPFTGREDAIDLVYSFGHRNPQGLAVHPETGALFASEHGPKGGDEVNLVRPGRNYGWPLISHGEEYSGGPVGLGTHRDGLEQPLYFWVPSIATAGIAFYTGTDLPGWQGNLFVAGLRLTRLDRLVLEGERVAHAEVLFADLWHRVRGIRESPAHELYVLTENGALFRVEPADPFGSEQARRR